MKSLYVNNIYSEIKGLSRKTIKSISSQTIAKQKRQRKLIRYELMAMGCFRLARCYQ